MVNTHINRAIGVDEALALGGALVDIVDVAIGRVSAGVEIKHVEEVCARVIISKIVGSQSYFRETSGRKERREMHVERKE